MQFNRKKLFTVEYWCVKNNLMLNASKTKEPIHDFLENPVLTPVFVKDSQVKIYNEVKYLGILFDNKLSFASHVDYVVSTRNKKFFFLHLLKEFGVGVHVMHMFYKSTIESVFCYRLLSFFSL